MSYVDEVIVTSPRKDCVLIGTFIERACVIRANDENILSDLFAGIINRLDYIEDLGVGTIWLNPIYPSPLIDSGYDVSNCTNINPLFGDLDDFDHLVRESHDRGMIFKCIHS